MIGYRHADSRYPFLWETARQPAARWHGSGESPCQYLADSPDGAWAEFLRHEEISDPADLLGIARSLWAIEVDDAVLSSAHHANTGGMRGDLATYPGCQAYARELRSQGVTDLVAPSAALLPGAARGQHVVDGLREAEDRNGIVWVLYGRRPHLRAWRVVEQGAPPRRTLGLVRHFKSTSADDGRRGS